MIDLSVRRVGPGFDLIAADRSELVLLSRTARASMAHGRLHAGATSKAIAHRTVDEIWYVTSGAAEIWRSNGERESIDRVDAGCSLAIPCETRFQFRTAGDDPFCFIMTTVPAWPGGDEAVFITGPWTDVDVR